MNRNSGANFKQVIKAWIGKFPPLRHSVDSAQDEQDVQHHLTLGNQSQAQGNWEAARFNYEQALAKKPNWEQPYLALGNLAIQTGNSSEALEYYHRAIALKPDWGAAYFYRGNAYQCQNKHQEAIADYQQAMELQLDWPELYPNLERTLNALAVHPHRVNAYRKLANIQATQNKLQDAVATYQKLLQLQPDWEVYLAVGNMLLTLGKPEEAVENYQQALALNPDAAEAYQRLGHLLNTEGKLEEAIAAYQKSLQLQPDWQTYIGAGNILTNTDKLDEAIVYYQKAVALNPEATEAYWRLGNIFVIQGKYEQAIAQYQQALDCHPDWKVYVVMGDSWLKLGQADKAVASYQQALQLNPDSAEAYWHLGSGFDHQGNSDRAIANYQKAINIAPDWAAPHFALGCVLSRQKQLEPALQSYAQALALKPDDGETYHRIANVLERLDRLEEALENCQQAIALEPTSAQYQMTMGSILVRQQKNQEAMPYYERAIALKPEWLDTYTQAGISLFLDGKYDEAAAMWHRGLEKQRELAEFYDLNKLGIRLLGASWLMAFGHIAFIDAYVKMCLLGWFPPHRTLMLLTPEKKVPNQCLLDYWKPYIEFIDNPAQINLSKDLLPYITDEFWAATLPDGQTKVHYRVAAEVQQQWEIEQRPHLLKLSVEERQRGWDCLAELGVPRDAWFVSLHVREPGFHQSWNRIYGEVRDANIENYLAAMESIVEFGGWVVRMGDPTMKPLPKMARVIDYAHSNLKSKWMDIFLCGECRFFIGTNSGLGLVPPNFGVPCVHTNWGPMGVLPYFGADIYTPKLYWSEQEERYLSFAETIGPPIGYSRFLKYYQEAGIQVIDNTAEDIEAVTREMLERLAGKLNYTPEDESWQERFHQIAIAAGAYRGSRVSRNFLSKYAYLL